MTNASPIRNLFYLLVYNDKRSCLVEIKSFQVTMNNVDVAYSRN